jgi:protein-S-isoprenylcysteine O-methyltransferase Ste14
MFPDAMAVGQIEVREGYHIERPNREKAASKATKAVVLLLLLASVGLVLIVTVGGWSKLAGMQIVQIVYMLVYLVMAYYVARWNRGVLPMAAALAIILGIFAAIAGPEWFDRDKTGFTSPALDESVLGLVTLLIVPVQLLLLGFSMHGFQQVWSVEVEIPDGEHYHPGMHFDESGSGGRPAPA